MYIFACFICHLHLEEVPVGLEDDLLPFRYPVATAITPKIPLHNVGDIDGRGGRGGKELDGLSIPVSRDKLQRIIAFVRCVTDDSKDLQ